MDCFTVSLSSYTYHLFLSLSLFLCGRQRHRQQQPAQQRRSPQQNSSNVENYYYYYKRVFLKRAGGDAERTISLCMYGCRYRRLLERKCMCMCYGNGEPAAIASFQSAAEPVRRSVARVIYTYITYTIHCL